MLIVTFVVLLLLFVLIPTVGTDGAPFMPTTSPTAKAMIDLARIQPGELVADLGSGDGRLVIALAKAGAKAYGFEINPLLVWWSRWRIYRHGLRKQAFVYWRNFWQEDLSRFSVITVFQLTPMMGRLGEKLAAELRPGARIVSNSWEFPGWKIQATKNGAKLYVKN